MVTTHLRHSRAGGNPEHPEINGLDSRLRGNDGKKGGDGPGQLQKMRKVLTFFLFVLAAGFPAIEAQPWFNPDGTKEFQAMARSARTALQNRQWHEALTILEQARRRWPRNGKIRLALAHLYRQVGLYSEAREHAGWTSRHGRGELRDLAYRELAWATWKLFLYEEALDALGEIREPLPADGALKARLHILRNEWRPALEALDHSGEGAMVSFWKGWCWWRLKDYAQARRHFAASGLPTAEALVGDDPRLSGNDPWLILGRMALRHQAGLPMNTQERARLTVSRSVDQEESAPDRLVLELLRNAERQ